MSSTEYFVDQPLRPIPDASTWENMSMNQLLEVQEILQSKAWDFRNSAGILAGIQAGLQKIEALIALRLSD